MVLLHRVNSNILFYPTFVVLRLLNIHLRISASSIIGTKQSRRQKQSTTRILIIPEQSYFYNLSVSRQSIMSSSFDPSLSTSGMRPPLTTADAPSMADSLPSINFGFEDLRNRMAQFNVQFDAFIERGRKQVLEERNQFRINLAEIQGESRTDGTCFSNQRLT